MINRFNRKELIYTVYMEGSISKAAQKLFISQPSLSVMIQKIEEEIGTPLFDRTSKPIRLTEAGLEYVKATEEILHIEKAFDNYLNAVNGLECGSLKLGSNQLMSSLVLPKYISAFINRYPKIDLQLVDHNSAVLEEMITSGQLDLIVDNQKMDPQIFEQRFLRSERLLLAVPKSFSCNSGLEEYRMEEAQILSGDHLTGKTLPVPLQPFQNVPFISMTRHNDTRHRSDDIFHEAGIKPRTILEIDRLVTLYSFVEMGTAASVVSDTLVRHIRHHCKDVWFYCLGSERAQREIYVTYKRNKYYSKSMEAFIDIVSDFIEA